MSTQIAVRLPDDVVAFIDQVVAHGDAASRAQVVTRAIERERRRQRAEEDAQIYATTEPDQDLESLNLYLAGRPTPDLD